MLLYEDAKIPQRRIFYWKEERWRLIKKKLRKKEEKMEKDKIHKFKLTVKEIKKDKKNECYLIPKKQHSNPKYRKKKKNDKRERIWQMKTQR